MACADPAPAAPDYEALAQIAGVQLVTPERGGEIHAISDTLAITRGNLPKGFVRDGSGVYVGQHFGLTYRYLVSCGDAYFTSCSEMFDTARVTATWEGHLAMGELQGPMRRTAMWNLSGIQGAMARVIGTSQLTSQDVTFADAPERTYRVTDHTDVAMFAEMADGAMMGGSLVGTLSVVVVEGAFDDAFDVAFEVSVDARQIARLTLDGEHEYSVDLTTGAITPW